MFTALRRFFDHSTLSRTRARRAPACKTLPLRRLELESLEERLAMSGLIQVGSPIFAKYASLGGPSGILGPALGPEAVCPDNIGHYEVFQNGAIYWSPSTQAHDVLGPIFRKWGSMGWERSFLGYPTTDWTTTGKGDGKFVFFRGGLIMWSPSTDAHEVHGAILAEYAYIGYEQSVVGYPLTDESGCADGVGRYNHFQTGSIFWSPNTGAHETNGIIDQQYASMGYERSPLGYPLTDEQPAEHPEDRMNLFQNGEIHWQGTGGNFGDLVQTVYRVNWSTVRFTWNFYNDPEAGFSGFLVSAHPTGTFSQFDAGGGGYSGSWDVTAYSGYTFSFSIDPYYSYPPQDPNWPFGPYYPWAGGWFHPLIYTVP